MTFDTMDSKVPDSGVPGVPIRANTRADFKRLAEIRIGEAKALLDLGMWNGAYYLAGYAVELSLKACIIGRVMSWDRFLDKNFSDQCYVHDIGKLAQKAGLENDLAAATKLDASFSVNCGTVAKWSEQTRYDTFEEQEALDIYNAISDPSHGVLQWIATHY